MSQEKKNAQRGKERLSKNAKCCTETQEEYAKCKKTNCGSMMRKRQTKTNKLQVLNTKFPSEPCD